MDLSILAEVSTHWVHDLDPFVIKFGDNFGIRWYGVSYFFGFAAAFLLLRLYHKKNISPLTPEDQSNFLTYIILGVLIGGRLGYMFFYEAGRESLSKDVFSILKVWEGGMAIHGGFLGVAVSVIIFSKRNKYNMFMVGDFVASVAPAGLFFGRVANFINGELWGKVSQVQWAIIFPDPQAGPEPRHPSQLYEAGLEGLLLFLYVQHRFWRDRLVQKAPGQLVGEMLILYSIARIFCEKFREPDFGEDLVLGLSKGQFYSFGLIAGGIVLIVLARGRAGRLEKASGKEDSEAKE